MALNAQRLVEHVFPQVRQDYVERDAILYALGIGLGEDPLDQTDLDYLLETRLKLLPTFAATLASLGLWVADPSFGIDVVRLVHQAQAATFLKPLPPRGAIIASARIMELADRGAGKGASLVLERTLGDAKTGDIYCVLKQSLLLRGDGGFGGPPPAPRTDWARPDCAPDLRLSRPVSPRAALIYRLSGDWNPLHADPEIARSAGFARPILHGYASYGMAGWAIIRSLAAGDACALESLSAWFTGVIYPGDQIDFSIWRDKASAVFQAHVGDRLVLDRGQAVLRQ